MWQVRRRYVSGNDTWQRDLATRESALEVARAESEKFLYGMVYVRAIADPSGIVCFMRGCRTPWQWWVAPFDARRAM